MIVDFRCAETERIWRGELSRKLPTDMQRTILRKLRIRNNAKTLRDLMIPPNNRLEALKGDRAGQHGIRVNDQWRLCFVWTEGGPAHGEVVDYH
jgi:proteic killer suppression protein